jgi:hypothetical protein
MGLIYPVTEILENAFYILTLVGGIGGVGFAIFTALTRAWAVIWLKDFKRTYENSKCINERNQDLCDKIESLYEVVKGRESFAQALSQMYIRIGCIENKLYLMWYRIEKTNHGKNTNGEEDI